MDANEIIERRACITGVGQSDIGRRLVPRPARADARRVPRRDRATPGLTTADIDGVVDLPGTDGHAAGLLAARASYDVQDALRLELRLVRQRARDARASSARSINACLAVAAGLANHVLCFRSRLGGLARRATRAAPR